MKMEILEKAIKLLQSNEYHKTIDTINDFLDENPHYRTIDYRHFANPIEEILYDLYVDKMEDANVLAMDECLEDVYQILAIAYSATGNLDEALRNLKIANQINPVSSIILMRIVELHQQRHEEDKIKPYVCDIFRYAYDTELITSNYFKLADYLYHTNKNMELYDHLFNFYMFLISDEAQKPVREDIEYFRANNVPVGVNMEIIKILFYLIDMHTKQDRPHAVEYFNNILWEVSDYNEILLKIENEG